MSQRASSGALKMPHLWPGEGSRAMDRVFQGCLVAVAFFPSFLAVVLPFTGTANNSDVAVVANNTLVVVVVVVVAWNCGEWGWCWLSDLASAKNHLLNHVNSELLSLTDAEVPPTLLLGAREVKRIMDLESIAMAGCLVGSAAACLVMLLSRKWIVVHPQRQQIVFSNLNLALYMLWSIFRVAKLGVEKMKRETEVVAPEEAEYNLLTTRNIHSFVEQYESHASMAQLVAIIGPFKSSQLFPKKSVTGNDLAKLEKAASIEPETPNQHETTKPQPKIAKAAAPKAKPPAFQNTNTFFLSDTASFKTSTLHTTADKVEKRLSTIFEEPELFQETYPGIKHVRPLRPKPCKLELAECISPENRPSSFLSLHGIPFKSQIRSLVTRHKAKINQNEAMEHGIDHIADYTEEERSCRDLDLEFYQKVSVVDLVYELVTVLRYIRDNYSVVAIIKEPSMVVTIYQRHLQPLFQGIFRASAYGNNIQIAKEVAWHAANKHFFPYVARKTDRLSGLYTCAATKIKNGTKLIFFVVVELPVRLVSMAISLLLFIPRLSFGVFVVYPFLWIRCSLYANNSDETATSSVKFQGMREFNLKRAKRLPEDYSTRKHLQEKVLRKLSESDKNIDAKSVPTKLNGSLQSREQRSR